MRILNIMQCTNLGGMEQASLLTMRGLQSRGHACEVLSLNPVGRLGEALAREGISAEGIQYRGRGGVLSVPQIHRRLRRHRADRELMTGHSFGAMLALESSRRSRRVLTMHFHHGSVMSPLAWRLIYRLAERRFHAITFMTDFIRQEAEEIYPPIGAIAHTVPYAFEVPPAPSCAARATARQLLGVPEDVPVIGNAGWLIPRKRFDVFLQVAQRVLRRHGDAVFLIAGDGPEREKLHRLAAELGIASQIKWLGWQSQLNDFYSSLDVLLFNSDWDALGRTPLEALAFGVPSVASIVHGGLSEVIDRDDYGLVRSTHDVEELESLVTRLIERPDLRQQIVNAGRAHLADVGSLERHTNRMSALLEI